MSAALLDQVAQRALDLGVPLSAHLDVTYRCNERCVHCYLNHDDRGEMSLAEIKDVLRQLAESGTFFLAISGGEPFVRKDIFDILERARKLMFSVKLKTNGISLREKEADHLRDLGIEGVQISVYSHRPAVHDAITKVRGSLQRTIRAIRFLRSRGLKVTVANVLMRENSFDYQGVRELAQGLGAHFTIDPTITPHLEGDASVVERRIPVHELQQVFRQPEVVGDVQEFCRPPAPADEREMQTFPCSAGHTGVYISPYAEVFPCVAFPFKVGDLRRQTFAEIWDHSPQLREVRSIRLKDLSTCSGCGHVGGCTRCPGLAYMEGDMRGPSSADCEKSFARTGVWSANMVKKFTTSNGLVQIQPASGMVAALPAYAT
jgi:AdoMet-dependent heme synthase